MIIPNKKPHKHGYKQGWYRLSNPEKFMKPFDESMKSYREGHVNYKSSMELKAFKFQDTSNTIIQWSQEPFSVPYLKPTTGKFHKYYIDMFIVTSKGNFLVEIKPKSATKPPTKPKKPNQRNIQAYRENIQEYQINQSKWKAQREFQERNNQKFVIFTEDQL